METKDLEGAIHSYEDAAKSFASVKILTQEEGILTNLGFKI